MEKAGDRGKKENECRTCLHLRARNDVQRTTWSTQKVHRQVLRQTYHLFVTQVAHKWHRALQRDGTIDVAPVYNSTSRKAGIVFVLLHFL